MSGPLPPAPLGPVPPPAAKLAIGVLRGQDVFFNSIGINLITQIWAALSGSGGAIDNIKVIEAEIAVIFDMHGDGTLTREGVLTVVSSEGRPFVASAFIDTTIADNITEGILPPARIGDGSIVYAKIQDETDATLLGRSAGAAGPPMEITVGGGLSLAGGVLSGTGGPGVDSNFVTVTAATNLNGNFAVKMNSSGLADVPSIASLADGLAIIGITTGAIATSASGPVQTGGTMVEPSWAWTAGEPVYVADLGALTQAVPAGAFVLQIGIAETATSLVIQPRSVISTL